MGKITHNRIAGSSKSSAMMKREASSFSCLLGNLASHKKSGNEITSYGKKKTDERVLHEIWSFEVWRGIQGTVYILDFSLS